MMKKLFLVPVVAIALLASCSKTLPQPEQISVNPSPLAVVGNKVNAEITGTFPQKKFAKKGTLVVTPVLKFDGQEVLGTPATYIGQKVKDNGTVVKYKEGGKYKQNVSFDYVPAMNESELYLRFTANIKGKTIEIPDVKIADGVMATAKLAKAQDNQTVLTADKFQRVIQQMQEADIKFLIQQSNLRESETSSKAVKDFQAAIKDASKDPKKSISKLEISGYASPEGGLELNTKLAEARQANAQKFIANKMQADNVNAKIQSSTTAEDWNGFQAAMENSNIQDKELVLRVLSMYSDPEEREAQIKNLSNVYKNIADEILPALRRSRMILTTDIIGKTDEEIKAMVAEDASKLNIEEILYAATLTNDNAEKAAIYQKAAEMYNDYRAYNNLGMVYYSEGNIQEARRAFAKALEIEPNNADVNYNAGLAALADYDLEKAEEYFGKAAGTSGNLSSAQGTLYTMKGEYQAATSAYGDANTNNAAIQQILNEDYAAARQTLANIKEPNATTAYLMAVVGARTNDREAVYSNLKVAVARNAEFKATAQKDIEFAKFAEDSEFKAIIK